MKRPFKLYRFWVRTLSPLARRRFTPTITGPENVPKEGPAILAANHLAVIDDAIIPYSVPRMVHFMGKAEYFTGKGVKGEFKKFFFTSAGVFPVDRSGGSSALGGLEAARRILDKGELFGIHPEGTRSPDGRLYRGHTGVARLAYETGAPIIPIALKGTDQAQPIGTVIPRKSHVSIQFGKPIRVEKQSVDSLTHEEIRALTDTIMQAIQKMSGQEYVDEYAQVVKARLREQQLENEQKAAEHRHETAEKAERL